MEFLHRLGYYLGGFSVGLVLLFFIFNGKRTQCHYGPEARVLDNLSEKNWVIKPSTTAPIQLDSLQIQGLLKTADVDFGASNTSLDSCKVYVLNSYLEKRPVQLTVENCARKVKLTAFSFKD